MNTDDLLMGSGTPRDPRVDGGRPEHRCLTCQIVEFADESALQRLVRFQAEEIARLQNRLLSEGDRREMERHVSELRNTIERQNALLGKAR